MSSRGPPRTIMVKRGVRYDWRESLESILEDGELSKFTVKPSGTLHLYVTRPKKDKSRSVKTSTKKKMRKNHLSTLLSWIRPAKNMLSPCVNERLTTREQCVQTDCTIPVCFELDETEECPCDFRPSSPILNGPKSKKGYFRDSNHLPLKEPVEPTFQKSKLPQKNLAVPKTKPRSVPKKLQPKVKTSKQSMNPAPPEAPPKPSSQERNSRSSSPLSKGDRSSKSSPPPPPLKEEEPPSPKLSNEKSTNPSIQPSKVSIPKVGSAPSKRKTIFPNESQPSDKEKPNSPPPQSKISSSSPRPTRDSSSKTTEGQRKSLLPSQAQDKRESSELSKPKRSKSPQQTENPLKPTIGLAQLTSLNQLTPQFNSHTVFTFDFEKNKFPNRQHTSRGDSWDSHVLERLHQSEGYMLDSGSECPTPKLLKQSQNQVADSGNQNLRGTPRTKRYCSHNYFDPTTKRNAIELEYNRSWKLSRKKGSYRISHPATHQKASREYDNARQQQSDYYPSKLTHWPPPKYNKRQNSYVKHDVYQQSDARMDHDVGSISADNSKTDLTCLVPNRLRKVYSYYEMVSNPSLTEMTPNASPTSLNTDTTTTTEIYPAVVTSQLSVEKSADDVHEFLLQIKNVLSRYFEENCRGKRKHDSKCLKLGKLNGIKLKNEEKDKPREKKTRHHQKKMQTPERKEGGKLMGLRCCY